MANGNQIVQALGGFTAGIQGQLPQFLQQQQAQQQQQQRQGVLQQLGQIAPGQLSQSQAFQQFALQDPKFAALIGQGAEKLDIQRQTAKEQDAQKARIYLGSVYLRKALQLAMGRLQDLKQLDPNADTRGTEEIIQLISDGKDKEALENLRLIEQIGIANKRIFPLEQNIKKAEVIDGQIVRMGPDGPFATDIQGFKADPTAGDKTSSKRDFDEFKRLEAIAKKTGDPKDIENAEQFGRQSRFLRLSEESASDLKVTETERKAIAKANVKRIQGFIDTGVTSADTTVTLRRSIALLDDIKTGGFDAVKLRVAQAFGIEGANELELSTNMGISFLAQLRPIFGAAFTVEEVRQLEKISAGFGKSTAGNRRLIEQTLKIANRAARRGLAAAIDQKDAFTAGEIRNALRFDVSPENGETPSQPEVTAQPAQPSQPAVTAEPQAIKFLRFK